MIYECSAIKASDLYSNRVNNDGYHIVIHNGGRLNLITFMVRIPRKTPDHTMKNKTRQRRITCKVCLSKFEPACIEEISKQICDSPYKSGSLGPIPHWLTKCIAVLALLIMEIINLSLSTGEMPGDYQNAMFIPPLKKISADQVLFKQF